MNIICFILLILFSFAAPAVEHNSCELLFMGSSNRLVGASFMGGNPEDRESDGTDELISYISDLLENLIIGAEELSRMIDDLEKNEVLNPILDKRSDISSTAMIHHAVIQSHLKIPNLDQTKLLEWSRNALKERSRKKKNRDQGRGETESIYQKIEFHRVDPKPFEYLNNQKKVRINLTHPFEMMSTTVTQKQWIDLMGENPSHFVDGDQTMQIHVFGKQIVFQPDNPVENMTWWSALEFANRLSLQMGLEPTYDFSSVISSSGHAETGTLRVIEGEVKINAPEGNIYKANGYRLPTNAEFEFVFRHSSLLNKRFQFFNDLDALRKHIWYSDNSDSKTHPVKNRLPFVLDGKYFYDFLGNVYQWVNDRYSSGDEEDGTDPKGPISGSWRVLRGCAYNSTDGLLPGAFASTHTGNCSSNHGFRLVRSVP